MTLLAYPFPFVWSGAQLAGPQRVQNIIDAVTNGVIAQKATAVPAAYPVQILETPGWTAFTVMTRQSETRPFAPGVAQNEGMPGIVLSC